MQQTIQDILADASIRLKRYTPGHTEQVRCPKCEGGRTREPSLTVSIDQDGDGATWICHRGSCGWRGGGRVPADRASPPKRDRPIVRPQPAAVADQAKPDWLYEFFAERKVGARTVNEFGVYATRRYYGEALGERPAIVFPYISKGELVNRKYRPFPEKQPQQQDKDALQTLFNVDRLGDAPPAIVWVEGEPDVMAMFECGIPHAVSLKDGAPQEATFREDDRRFEALRTHADLLTKVPRIILAGDSDTPGLALREELARRLGRHRCWTVDWPLDCKDACDVLRHYGPEAVQEAIQGAQPFPIDGLQRIKPGTLQTLHDRAPPAVMTTGTLALDSVVHLPTEGRLIVVTGRPGHGKTTLIRFVMIHTCSQHARRWAVFSPEMQPWEQFAAECAQVYCGKPFWGPVGVGMNAPDIADSEAWLGDRVVMLVCDAEDSAPTLDWIIERGRAAVLRDGTTDLWIDPWNEVGHERGALSETDYIGRGLQRLKAFGLRHGCNVWICTHPAKPLPLRPGEKAAAPGPYDISGSQHWANKSDLGLTVHSPNPRQTEVHLWKSRFRRWGRRGAIALLDFDELTGRYSSPVSTTSPEPIDTGRWPD